jgi:hypothetical protein
MNAILLTEINKTIELITNIYHNIKNNIKHIGVVQKQQLIINLSLIEKKINLLIVQLKISLLRS